MVKRSILLALLLSAGSSEAFWTSSKTEEEAPHDSAHATAKDSNSQHPESTSVEYGVDVSFPIHRWKVSKNYDWLPHNQDPSLTTPKEYEGEPVQVNLVIQQIHQPACTKSELCFNYSTFHFSIYSTALGRPPKVLR